MPPKPYSAIGNNTSAFVFRPGFVPKDPVGKAWYGMVRPSQNDKSQIVLITPLLINSDFKEGRKKKSTFLRKLLGPDCRLKKIKEYYEVSYLVSGTG